MAACDDFAIGDGGVEGPLGVRVVQRGEKLAFLDAHAFVKVERS